tara:strand:- start:503 stop:1231 length:729 start_codon:yes stop_codon:yes gene_type:complete
MKSFTHLKNLIITPNQEPVVEAPVETPVETPNGAGRFSEMEITEDKPTYLRVFPWIEELKPHLLQVKIDQGFSVPFEFLTDEPRQQWTVKSQRLIIDKFNYCLRMYANTLPVNANEEPKKFGTRTETASGARTVRSSDLAVSVRVLVKKSPALLEREQQKIRHQFLPPKFDTQVVIDDILDLPAEAPNWGDTYSQKETRIKWRRYNYLYLKALSEETGKPVTMLVQDMVEESCRRHALKARS